MQRKDKEAWWDLESRDFYGEFYRPRKVVRSSGSFVPDSICHEPVPPRLKVVRFSQSRPS